MVWRRLPTLFPNIRLHMLPLPKEKLEQIRATGWTREVAFRTDPKTSKEEIRAFMQAVHGMEVDRVHTINYQGKKKRWVSPKGRAYYYRRNDWKKVYVIFKPPAEELQKWQQQQAETYTQQLQQYNAHREQQRQRLRLWREQQRGAGLPSPGSLLQGGEQQTQQPEPQADSPGAAAAVAPAAAAPAPAPAAATGPGDGPPAAAQPAA